MNKFTLRNLLRAGVLSLALAAATSSAQYAPQPAQPAPRQPSVYQRPPQRPPVRTAHPQGNTAQPQGNTAQPPVQQGQPGVAQQLPQRYPNRPVQYAADARANGPVAPAPQQGPPAAPQPGQGVAGQPAPGQPGAAQPPGPMVPFVLTPQEQTTLDQVLTYWETESDKVKNYSCAFERWEYDPVWGPGANVPKTKGTEATLTYSKPDKGSFRIDKIQHYTPPKTPGGEPTYESVEGDPGERWVCDGKAVYEYKADTKQLKVYELPKEMQGKAIADGPLPFLFGAKKDKLKARYFLRVTQVQPQQIWLEAYPKYQHDAANFSRVELILDRKRFLPAALQVYAPNGKGRTVYIFKEASVNNPLKNLIEMFETPVTPLGWEKVIERAPAPAEQQQRQAQQQGVPPQGPAPPR